MQFPETGAHLRKQFLKQFAATEESLALFKFQMRRMFRKTAKLSGKQPRKGNIRRSILPYDSITDMRDRVTGGRLAGHRMALFCFF